MANDKKIKILVVDDDDSMRNLYAEVFKNEDFDVSVAIDGLDGLDKATQERPDIIFTGIIMPKMDGFSLIEALKKNIATNNIPVVISSHMGREEDQRKAQEIGARDFIARDLVTPKEAAERIRAVFNQVEYKIKFNPTEMDALKLASDLHLDGKFNCVDCGGSLILKLKVMDVKNHVFSARFACSQCDKEQK